MPDEDITTKVDADTQAPEKGKESEGTEPSQIDYKAEAVKERERRVKAEKALAARRFKESEQRREGTAPETEKESEEERPLTARELEEILARDRQQTRAALEAERIREIAHELSESDDEAELVMEIHRNRTFPADLSLQEQIEEAHAIANRKRVQSKLSEAARAAKSRETASRGAPGAEQEPAAGGEPQLPASTKIMLSQSGFSWDGRQRLYKKAINGGKKHLFFDPKTKKRWTV